MKIKEKKSNFEQFEINYMENEHRNNEALDVIYGNYIIRRAVEKNVKVICHICGSQKEMLTIDEAKKYFNNMPLREATPEEEFMYKVNQVWLPYCYGMTNMTREECDEKLRALGWSWKYDDDDEEY